MAKTIEGFTAETFTQGTVAADGSTVVNIYYKRNQYDITFVIDPISNSVLPVGGLPPGPAPKP